MHEMTALFRDVQGAVENTRELSARLQFALGRFGYEFPAMPYLRGRHGQLLAKRVHEGVMRGMVRREIVTY